MKAIRFLENHNNIKKYEIFKVYEYESTIYFISGLNGECASIDSDQENIKFEYVDVETKNQHVLFGCMTLIRLLDMDSEKSYKELCNYDFDKLMEKFLELKSIYLLHIENKITKLLLK